VEEVPHSTVPDIPFLKIYYGVKFFNYMYEATELEKSAPILSQLASIIAVNKIV